MKRIRNGAASRLASILVAAALTAGSYGCSKKVETKDGEVQVVKAVTGGSLAPYMYVDDKEELIGTDIDIVKEVFRRLPQYELKIEIADALQGVLSGQYDIAVNNYGYTKARGESYYYSLPYKKSFNVYIQRPDDTPLTSLQDIADRKYKIELGAGGLTAAALESWNEQNPDHKINILYTDIDFATRYQHVIDGVTDLAIDDGPIVDTLLGRFGMEGKLVGNEIDPKTEDFLNQHNNTYFLLTKDEKGKAIRDAITPVLQEMKKDGTIAEITKKYLGKDESPKDDEYMQAPLN
jgi:polar amino acid transport system substrate-binding protein